MPENKPEYDFNFITLSLGLIPIQNGVAAINPGAITSLQWDSTHMKWKISMHGGTTYLITVDDMVELEESIKRRAEETKVLQREAMRNHAVAQNEIIAEMNNKVQDPRLMPGIPVIGKRMKH